MNLLRVSKLPKFLRTREVSDGAVIDIIRGYKVEDSIRLGPNQVHAIIGHADGSYEDLGVSQNLITTVGIDLVAAALGAPGPAQNTATAVGATSLTDSGESWTTDEFKGWTVFAEESTNRPVFGNIGSNNGTVLTIDDWYDPDDSAAAADPGATADYIILPTCRPRYMGITADTAAASAASTTLTSEQTGNGLARALATYAHTPAAATFTLQKQWTASGTVADLHRMGLFTAANTTAAGILVFEAVLNADASVVSSDTLTVTDTVTLS
jgi:hypothetical protein